MVITICDFVIILLQAACQRLACRNYHSITIGEHCIIFLNPYFYIRVIIGVRIIPAKKRVKSIQLDKSNSVIRVESIHIKARVPGSKFQGFRGSEVPGSAFRV